MKNAVSFICFLVVLCGCSSGTKRPPEYFARVVSSIDQFPDTSYFSKIRSMQYADGKVYVLDIQRRDVGVLSEDFGTFETVGSPGFGPQELTIPLNFYVYRDTIYVLDGGAESVKAFFRRQYVGAYRLKRAGEGRFFMTDGIFVFPIVDEKGIIEIVPRSKEMFSGSEVFGTLRRFPQSKQTMIRNDYDLLGFRDTLYAVSDNLSVVRRYTLFGRKQIDTCDLSTYAPLKENLAYIASEPFDENTYYVSVEDSYFRNGKLYLLCSTLEKPYRVNTLLAISFDPVLNVSLIHLPGEIYGSFCVSDRYIFAFNEKRGTIEKLEVDDKI